MGKNEGRHGSGEAPVLAARLHWVMIAGPAALMIIAGLSIGQKGTSAVLILALAVIWGIFSSISLELSEIVLTRERLFVRIGFPWRRSYAFPLKDIEGVNVYQPSLGKVLDFGKITIKPKNGRRTSFRMVRSPHLLVQKVYECKQDGQLEGR